MCARCGAASGGRERSRRKDNELLDWGILSDLLGSALIIFVLRLADVSIGTVRMLMVIRGRKVWAWTTGFITAIIYLVAIRIVLADLDNLINILGYSAGFATGNVMGMWMEERLSVGHTHLRIVSSRRGAAVAEGLREAGYAVTEIPARGKDGMVTLLNCTVLRRDSQRVQAMVKEIDPEAFITSEDLRPVERGFWGRYTLRRR